MVRDEGAVQASKPSPVKTAPPARATRLRQSWEGGGAGSGSGVDQDRPPSADRLGRAALIRGGRPQIDGPAVEPDAHPRVFGQAEDRPRGRRLHRAPGELDRPGAGAARRQRALPRRQQGKRPQHAQKERAGAANFPALEPHGVHSRCNKLGVPKVAPMRAKICKVPAPGERLHPDGGERHGPWPVGGGRVGGCRERGRGQGRQPDGLVLTNRHLLTLAISSPIGLGIGGNVRAC